MSQTASQRPKKVLVVLFALAVVAVVAFAFWRLTGGDDAKPLATGTDSTSSSAPTSEVTTTSTPTPSPKSSATGKCDGPDTKLNLEGTSQDSLLPDCGNTPVTVQQQQKKGLGLACGGSYPVILYKTTTSGARASICGKDASGESFRLVTKPTGGEVVDAPGSYDPQQDAFVARKDGTSYVVQAYNGDLIVTKDGRTTTHSSDGDWVSLDNESDYD